MSLTPIPNQPINLLPSEIIGGCEETAYPTLIAEGDTVLLQFQQSRCENAEQYIDSPDFTGVDWRSGVTGFTVQSGGGVCAVPNNGGSALDNTAFTPGGGNLYELVVNVSSVQGSGFRVNVAGLSFDLTGPGMYQFTFIGATADPLEIELIDDTSAGCIDSIFVYEGNQSFELAIVGEDGNDIAAVNPGDEPYLFTYTGSHVVVEWPLPVDVEGCFTFVLRDQCEYTATEWCSQVFKVVECGDTIKLRVCNDSDAMGFAAGRFEVRVEASLVRPSWEYEVAEERLSNGQINRHFIDRQAAYQLLIEIQGDKLHPFLAAMAMFDHFYINDGAWSIDAETYTPGYGDALTGAGGVALQVRKRQELARKVLCDALGEGCAPDDDPICNTADVLVTTEFVDGDLFVRVDVLSSFGFEVDSIEWTLNGVDQTSIPVGGVAGPYALGPVEVGDTVRLTFVNAQDPLCNDVRDAFEVEAPACPEDSVRLLLGDETGEGQGQLAAWGSDGYWSVVYNGGTPFVWENTEVNAYLGAGTYCIYPSDDEGNPSGVFGESPLAAGSIFGIGNVEILGADYAALATGELHDEVLIYPAPVASKQILLPYAKQRYMQATDDNNVDLQDHVWVFVTGAWAELEELNIGGGTTTTPFAAVWPSVFPSLDTVDLSGDWTSASMDALASALNPLLAGTITATGTVTPTSASQATRQALYDNGWTLPASWLTDLTP